MEEEKRLGRDLRIYLVMCFFISLFCTCINQDDIANYFDAVYEEERDLVHRIAEDNFEPEEFPGASVYEDKKIGVVRVYYAHNEKNDNFFRFPIIIQMNEEEIEIPKYFINREEYIRDRTSRKIISLTFKMTFILMFILTVMRMIYNIIHSKIYHK